jgi:hypothetical protein
MDVYRAEARRRHSAEVSIVCSNGMKASLEELEQARVSGKRMTSSTAASAAPKRHDRDERNGDRKDPEHKTEGCRASTVVSLLGYRDAESPTRYERHHDQHYALLPIRRVAIARGEQPERDEADGHQTRPTGRSRVTHVQATVLRQ